MDHPKAPSRLRIYAHDAPDDLHQLTYFARRADAERSASILSARSLGTVYLYSWDIVPTGTSKQLLVALLNDPPGLKTGVLVKVWEEGRASTTRARTLRSMA